MGPQRSWRTTFGPGIGLILATAAALACGACGPSFQAVYECDVRFEHCYALDQGPAAVDAKKGCWRDWLHGYTYGQSWDRVEYAATRFSQLSLDPTLPNEDVRSPGSRGRRSERTVAGPVPTNAFAPPPNVSEGHPAPEASVSASASSSPREPPPPPRDAARHAPGADCADSCAEKWSSCHTGCKDKACEACDRAYKACMPACFREEPATPKPAR